MRSLGDSLHLIFLNPAKRRAVLVGVPRDSYMPIPGHGSGKINSSMVYGGPELMVATMEQNFGVTIDYWALTTFWGFTDMINAVGGLTVDVPFPMVDFIAATSSRGSSGSPDRRPSRSRATVTASTRATSAGRRTAAG